MINFVCCSVVVDNCDFTPKQLQNTLLHYIGLQGTFPNRFDVKVIEGYYPKQRIIVVPSAEHVKKVLLALWAINDEEQKGPDVA